MKHILPLPFKTTLLALTCVMGALVMRPHSLSAQGEPGQEVPPGPPTSKQKEAAMAETQELFGILVGHAKKANYAAFARHLVYSGSNPLRKMQELVNYDDTFERLECEHASNRLREYISRGELYNLSNFRTIQWMNQEMAIWDLDVSKKNGKAKKHTVTFVKVKGKYEYVGVE